ncbi:alpha/beta hydrolase [Lentzea sp. NPDC060358]|uniref:alpha/beta hydrolase n=1 Tax=Lentzea sp. NPDC060358 TaxID=3347103 RepID=UPI00365705F1
MGPTGLFDLTDVEGTREALRAFGEAPKNSTVAAEEHLTTGIAGSSVPIHLLRPATPRGPLPVLLWFHGGGQVLGYAAQDDFWLMPLCETLGCAVASVEYRLAPETPAPGAAEDGLTAYQWLLDQAEALKLDPTRIGIAGQSGGGGIAAATTLLIRDRGLTTPLFQSLLYPMLDDRNTTTSSNEITDIGIWDRGTNILAWQAILGDATGQEVSQYAAPARATDLSGLPPTFMAVGELDLFRDEDLDYAHRLLTRGVPVDLHLYSGAYHAFDLFAPTARVSRSLRQTWSSDLDRRFEGGLDRGRELRSA